MPNLDIENTYANKIVAGVDEVGCGALAGPVVASVVIINRSHILTGIKDSKQLSPNKRQKIYDNIINYYHHSIGIATVEEINTLNVRQATILACKRAVNNFKYVADIVLVDGNMKFHDYKYVSVLHGDQISLSIAAASIVAKVTRDHLMLKLSEEYPLYSWQQNKGYGTSYHLGALEKYGPTPHHRTKFITKFI